MEKFLNWAKNNDANYKNLEFKDFGIYGLGGNFVKF